MADQKQNPQGATTFASLRDALQSELDQLKKNRHEITLFEGVQAGTCADHFYYRFEVPEDLFLHPIEFASFSVGSSQQIAIKGRLVDIDNQFLTVALPIDFGPYLPEVGCTWNYEQHLLPVLSRLPSAGHASFIASLLFNPSDDLNSQSKLFDPHFTPQTPENQSQAITKILQTRVSFLWGPVNTGKTRVLALLALNYVKAGKKVLFVSTKNAHVDHALLQTVDLSQQIAADLSPMVVRMGFPSATSISQTGQHSFEQQMMLLRNEKRKVFQERVQLLNRYQTVRVKQCLNEDFFAKIQAMRERLGEIKKQADQIANDVEVLRATLQSQQSASMIEKLKKGFSKDDQALAQKQLSEKQQAHKRLLSLQQSLSNEITLTESNSPITAEEMKEYRFAMKRIEELGGPDRVTQAVEEFAAIDEIAELKKKSLVCATVQSALADERLKGFLFDVVLVDDAETIQLPALTALATYAKDQLVVAGDPFQLEPGSFSKDILAEAWLRRDIFLHVARTEQLHTLFDWTEQNTRWVIPLRAQFAATPTLPLFAASVLFDDKINVFVPPQAKGRVYFIDTSTLRSTSKQYLGRKKILPSNELHTKHVIDCIKHLLLSSEYKTTEIGVVLPFGGPTFYTKLQLRMNGMDRIEVGTPESFHGTKKRAIIFDTTMAGVDHTMKQIDDRKSGEHRIARLLNTVFSCVGEDLYVLADMNHFRSVYKDRLFTRLLLLLQAQAEQPPSFSGAVKKFEGLEWDQVEALLSESQQGLRASAVGVAQPKTTATKEDVEHALRMKMMAQQGGKPVVGATNVDRETHDTVVRILGVRNDLNLLTQYIGGDVLFGSSLSAVRAVERLPHDFCQSEKAFREIMERWNLIIYELSGGHKADHSYFSKKSPEARVRHDIRNLRVFYGSDVEAAIEEGKQKIAVEVSRVFQELLGKTQPSNPSEWSKAYLSFLAKLETYLFWISEQIRR